MSSGSAALWLDKHRPKRLNKLDYHKRQAEHLERLVKSDFPHLLMSGPSGSGKKTRLVAMLRELYGAGSERLRIEHQNFETPSKKKLEIITVASNYHIEVGKKFFAFLKLFCLKTCSHRPKKGQPERRGDLWPRRHPRTDQNGGLCSTSSHWGRGIASFQGGGDHRSRQADQGRSARPPPDHGEVHVHLPHRFDG